MIGQIWYEYRVIVIAGILLLVVAYGSGTSYVTLGWLLLMFLLLFGLLLFKALRSSLVGTEPQSTDFAPRELAAEMDSLVRQIEEGTTDITDHIHVELVQVRSLLSDAIITLLDSFNGLNHESRVQNRVILGVLDELYCDRGQDDSGIAFHDVISKIEDALHLSVEHIREISEHSAAMVEQIDQMVRHMDGAKDLVVDARGGAVVADDVRVLSQRSERFNQEVANILNSSREHIDMVQRSAAGFVRKDLSLVLESRARVDAALQELGNMDEVLGDQLKDVSGATHRIDRIASDAVRSLQFEDIARQLTESSERHLRRLERLLATVASGVEELKATEPSVPEYVAGLHALTLRIKKMQPEPGEVEKTVVQSSMGKGEADLF
ncbi:MAG: hypothetical protein GY814_13430 [Gammaproteobacteria bacterium]|nr:hypothetical protein [Gammaproteobacteria bacterium]